MILFDNNNNNFMQGTQDIGRGRNAKKGQPSTGNKCDEKYCRQDKTKKKVTTQYYKALGFLVDTQILLISLVVLQPTCT